MLDSQYVERIIEATIHSSKEAEMYGIGPSIWHKLYKASIIKDNNICFDECRRTWEDGLFNAYCLKYASSIYYLPEVGYYYVKGTPGSLTKTFNNKILNIALENYRIYHDEFDSKKTESDYCINYFIDLILEYGALSYRSHCINKNAIIKEMMTEVVDNSYAQFLSQRYTGTDALNRIAVKCIEEKKTNELVWLLKLMCLKKSLRNGIRKIRKLF